MIRDFLFYGDTKKNLKISGGERNSPNNPPLVSNISYEQIQFVEEINFDSDTLKQLESRYQDSKDFTKKFRDFAKKFNVFTLPVMSYLAYVSLDNYLMNLFYY